MISSTDQYLYRAGIVQMVPKVKALRGLAFSAGIRGEGVPVHDLIGANDGFRRPGFIFSFDPGLMFNYKRDTLSVNGPWAIFRDRPPSVPERSVQHHQRRRILLRLHGDRHSLPPLLARSLN